MNLIIVESPTKARKLSGYVGSDYRVEASVGHVRDLPQKQLGVDIEHDFEPTYQVVKGKTELLKKLTKLSQSADTVFLAMDPDREGEAIAWHVHELLSKATSKQKPKFVRATFHEITKSAVLAAIENPTQISLDLVNAQQARRVLDRLVGYKVSPVLWRKIRRGLSAGRVQSVALRLVVEREKEIAAFKPEEYWEVAVALGVDETMQPTTIFAEGKSPEKLPKDIFIAQLDSCQGKTFAATSETQVLPIVSDLKVATYVVDDVQKKQRARNPYPPLITSTLQQAAASTLGFSASQTMRLAQQLYEEGLITYHRTDSFSLSQQALEMARNYIASEYGDRYLPPEPQFYRRKSKNAQEAHEAIRVTDVTIYGDAILAKAGSLTVRHQKLYDLIRARFLASQMTSAEYEQTTISVTANHESRTYSLKTTGSIQLFEGWTKLFPSQKESDLPNVSTGQKLAFTDCNPQQKFTQPPPRFNDASLIKELEKRDIGRPSTYASIITVLIDRAYVERLEKRFFATAIGMTVSDFLVEHFDQIMDYDFTAEMEEDLDRIARGEKDWHAVVRVFYGPLAKKIDAVIETAERAKIPVESTGLPCPKCGATEHGEIVLRTGRYGKFKSCSRFPECDFTENVVETVPNVVCPLCKEGAVIARKTRWGKLFYGCARYPACDWAGWQQPKPGYVVTPEEWAIQQQARAERKAAREAKMEKENPGSTQKATKTKKTTRATKSAAKTKASKRSSAKKAVKKTASSIKKTAKPNST